MRIVFDRDFKKGFWPGPLHKRDAAIGELWVGEDGFRDALEMALGRWMLSGVPNGYSLFGMIYGCAGGRGEGRPGG